MQLADLRAASWPLRTRLTSYHLLAIPLRPLPAGKRMLRWLAKRRPSTRYRSLPLADVSACGNSTVAANDLLYLDGGFGVGKTHLLAASFHAAPGDRRYLSFAEAVGLAVVQGPDATIDLLTSDLVCIDEFELDDPSNTRLIDLVLEGLIRRGTRIVSDFEYRSWRTRRRSHVCRPVPEPSWCAFRRHSALCMSQGRTTARAIAGPRKPP